MSNRIVPKVYRDVIDDTIANIRGEFEEYGVEEDVLEFLQQRWEANLVESRVAPFDANQPQPPSQYHSQSSAGPSEVKPNVQQQHGQGYMQQQGYGQQQGYVQQGYGGMGMQGQGQVKMEDVDALRLRGGAYQEEEDVKPHIPTSDDEDEDDDFDDGLGMPDPANPKAMAKFAAKYTSERPMASSSSSDVKPSIPPAQQYHEHKPMTDVKPGMGNGNTGGSRGVPDANGLLPGDDIIDSDLDDDDEEDDEEKEGDGSDDDAEDDGDYMLCVYDKVQRVKNKWKTTFKDGLIHVKGKDYLFNKCTGEFEW